MLTSLQNRTMSTLSLLGGLCWLGAAYCFHKAAKSV